MLPMQAAMRASSMAVAGLFTSIGVNVAAILDAFKANGLKKGN